MSRSTSQVLINLNSKKRNQRSSLYKLASKLNRIGKLIIKFFKIIGSHISSLIELLERLIKIQLKVKKIKTHQKATRTQAQKGTRAKEGVNKKPYS